jgi:hypothetical protein
VPSKSGAKPTRKGSSKRPRKPTLVSLESSPQSISQHSEEEPNPSDLRRQLLDLLHEANPQGADVLAAVASGTVLSATIADTHEAHLQLHRALIDHIRDMEPRFPITVRQANALLIELEREWIKDKDVVTALLREMRIWLAMLSNGHY